MRTLVGAIAAILVAAAAATGVTFGVANQSNPDKKVNFETTETPNPHALIPGYGDR